ncbi:hypothetical protein VP01_608g6 [Puccinia sorghi]|uniref:Uncharacterized protein n=1 Tax=Puccinia sorghi TaxID=27349 RepID=A0A0L6UH53_9BASI|nr:hypothetical protein VP01_608g6 [Puccinia sorghi]
MLSVAATAETRSYRLAYKDSTAPLIKAHMSKEKFVCLANRIRGDPIFLPKGNKPQALVKWQLLVMLANLGVSGTAGGSAFLSPMFWYICWVFIQLHIPLPPGFNMTQKGEDILNQTSSKTVKNKEDYWMCKMLYGLNSMIFCNQELRIIYALHVWCRSAHDSHVMQASHISSNGFSRIMFAY